MSRSIYVGLIGFGMGGRMFHAPFIKCAKGLKLRTIRETKPDKIAYALQTYPGVDIVPDVKDIFNDEAIELVIITVPNQFHFDLAKEALLAGKNVVVDKPFTATTAQADELITLAKERNKMITVFQNRRFDSDFLTVQKVIDSKVLGNLVEYESHYDRFRNFINSNTWKEENIPGGGILYNLGVHLIDQALVLFGLPEAIFGDVRIQRQGSEIPDNFEIILHYPQLKVTLKAGTLVKENDLHFILLGDQGSFIKNGLDVQEEDLQVGLSPETKAEWGVEPEAIWGSLNTTFKDLNFLGKIESEKGDYRKFYENIYKHLIGEEELIVKPEEGRNAIRIIELAVKSNEEKKTVHWAG